MISPKFYHLTTLDVSNGVKQYADKLGHALFWAGTDKVNGRKSFVGMLILEVWESFTSTNSPEPMVDVALVRMDRAGENLGGASQPMQQ